VILTAIFRICVLKLKTLYFQGLTASFPFFAPGKMPLFCPLFSLIFSRFNADKVQNKVFDPE
jgi:hypothetical protein